MDFPEAEEAGKDLPEAEKEFGGKGSKACAYGDGTNWMPVDRFLQRLFGMLCHVVVMLCVLCAQMLPTLLHPRRPSMPGAPGLSCARPKKATLS